MNILRIPKKLYFKPGSMPVALKELDEVYGIQRAFVVSSYDSRQRGYMDAVNDWIRDRGIRTCGFYAPAGSPSAEDIDSGMQKLAEFKPQVIIAVGDSVVVDTAKLLWKQHGDKGIMLVFVQQGAGRCSACSPYAVSTDASGKLTCIKDYDLLPEIAVIDPQYFGATDEASVLRESVLALENAVAAFSADDSGHYVQAIAREAAWQVIDNVEAASGGSEKALIAQYHIANAAALAAMAFGSSADEKAAKASLESLTADEGSLKKKYDKLVKTTKSHLGRSWL